MSMRIHVANSIIRIVTFPAPCRKQMVAVKKGWEEREAQQQQTLDWRRGGGGGRGKGADDDGDYKRPIQEESAVSEDRYRDGTRTRGHRQTDRQTDRLTDRRTHRDVQLREPIRFSFHSFAPQVHSCALTTLTHTTSNTHAQTSLCARANTRLHAAYVYIPIRIRVYTMYIYLYVLKFTLCIYTYTY